MSDMLKEFRRYQNLEGNEAVRCSRMHFRQWADELESLTARLAAAEAARDRLWVFVAEQHCECYDEYGNKFPVECDRCQLLRAAKGGRDE